MFSPSISVVQGDVLNHVSDLLVLKHADGFYGVDDLASDRVHFRASVAMGDVAVVNGRGTESRKVAFIGVGPLNDFRYAEIRAFGRRATSLTKERETSGRLTLTTHGVGYGLDEREAFLSLLAGIEDALSVGDYSPALREIEIVENTPSRASRLTRYASEFFSNAPSSQSFQRDHLADYGRASESKTKLFVAMPFASTFDDEWNVAIADATAGEDIVCERLDAEAFVGDILAELKHRIATASGVIAVVTGANPNVFLEIGFAWGIRKPTILLAREGETLPFDIRGQRCLKYQSIGDLRTKLRAELSKLKSDGVFNKVSAQ